jgi:GWxTD domain-containing protein
MFVAGTAAGQSIASTNMNYLYDPAFRDEVIMRVVNTGDSIQVHYQIDPALTIVGWERRQSYSERGGEIVEGADNNRYNGVLSFPRPAKSWLLVVRVSLNGESLRQYFKPIESAFPVNSFMRTPDNKITGKYFNGGKGKIESPTQEPVVFFYKTDFPPASPPFSGRDQSSRAIFKHDSVYTIDRNEDVIFTQSGLYLVQPDSSSSFGFSFRVEPRPYPKINRIRDLVPPLIYLCTQEEYGRLLAAGEDKSKFDKVILEITGDKDRAKDLMKFYFRRVEQANTLFTSYKEGWKTDRGMLLIIFGVPDEVFFNSNNELWSYNDLKLRFNFVRSGSIYDPDNYVLIRERRHSEVWYYTIDLWRKDQLNNQKF